MKTKISASIDHDLYMRAKEDDLNISAILNTAIAREISSVKAEILKPDKCALCGRVEEKATALKPKGMTWLWPEKYWICSLCLRKEINMIIHNKIAY